MRSHSVSELYFLVRGEALEIWEGYRTKPLRRLVSGDFCGEFSMLTDTTSAVSVVAVTPCETFMLGQEAFRKLLLYFPGARSVIEGLRSKRAEDVQPHASFHRRGVALAYIPQSPNITPSGQSSPKPDGLESKGAPSPQMLHQSPLAEAHAATPKLDYSASGGIGIGVNSGGAGSSHEAVPTPHHTRRKAGYAASSHGSASSCGLDQSYPSHQSSRRDSVKSGLGSHAVSNDKGEPRFCGMLSSAITAIADELGPRLSLPNQGGTTGNVASPHANSPVLSRPGPPNRLQDRRISSSSPLPPALSPASSRLPARMHERRMTSPSTMPAPDPRRTRGGIVKNGVPQRPRAQSNPIHRQSMKHALPSPIGSGLSNPHRRSSCSSMHPPQRQRLARPRDAPVGALLAPYVDPCASHATNMDTIGRGVESRFLERRSSEHSAGGGEWKLGVGGAGREPGGAIGVLMRRSSSPPYDFACDGRRSSAASAVGRGYHRRVSRGSESVRSSSICSSAFDVDTAMWSPHPEPQHSSKGLDGIDAAEELECQMREAELVASRRRVLLWPKQTRSTVENLSPPTPPELADLPPSPRAVPETQHCSSIYHPCCLLYRSTCQRSCESVRARLSTLSRATSRSLPVLPLISPNSSFRTTWLFSVVAAIAITAIELPYRLGYEPTRGEAGRAATARFMPIELTCDIVFVLDLLLSFRLARWHHLGVVVDAWMIFRSYATTLLPLNLVAFLALPLSAVHGYSQPWTRLPALARLVQLPRFVDAFLLELRHGQPLDNYSALKLRNLLCLSLFMIHVTAGLYGLVFQVADSPLLSPPTAANVSAVGTAAAAVANTTIGATAGIPSAPLALTPFQRSYAYGIWWTVGALSGLGSLASTPDPQPARQLAFTTAVLVGALFTTTYLIAQLGVLISNLDASAHTLRKKRNATALFVRRQGLPAELAARLSRYQQLAWTRGVGHNLRTVVGQMNATIRADIMHHICHAVVIAVPLFNMCEPKHIFMLMEAMMHDVCPQGEWICHRGSVATCMYIILQGEIAVVVDEVSMISVAKLNRGDFFGERSLFRLEKRNASIVAKTTVDLAVLSSDAFARLIQDQPQLRDALEEAKSRREAEMEAARHLMQEQIAPDRAPRHTSLSASLGSRLSMAGARLGSLSNVFRRHSALGGAQADGMPRDEGSASVDELDEMAHEVGVDRLRTEYAASRSALSDGASFDAGVIPAGNALSGAGSEHGGSAQSRRVLDVACAEMEAAAPHLTSGRADAEPVVESDVPDAIPTLHTDE